MDRETILKLLEEDDLGLLNIKPKVSAQASADQRLVSAFLEIVEFVRQKNREPEPNKNDIKEMQLYSRLNGIRGDDKKIATLKEHDILDLLGDTKKRLESIEDVFSDDDIGLLNDGEDNIFELKNIPQKSISNFPEYIARRKQCADFDNFEHLMKSCQSDLATGKRKLSKFENGSQIDKGEFFVLKGQLVYVADEKERELQPGAEQGRLNDRLRCIFENGTESDMLRRSLAARLYEEDGQRVSRSSDQLFLSVNEITEDDRQTGFVYILRSRSENPEIKALKNLFKIGFSRGPVEDRVKNASQEATYLMAPVHIVTAYQCYNLNPQKLEALLHNFFGSACLSLEVIDNGGRKCVPKEWFIAPLPVITQSVELLISGEIVNYRYNSEKQEIERR